jgi:hypothetical protein
MGPGTSSGSTALDSATRELTRAVLLFSLAGRMRPGDSPPGGALPGPPPGADSTMRLPKVT